MKKWTVVLVCLLSPISFAGWTRQTSTTMLPLKDVCFVDSLYGWAVGGHSYMPPDSSYGICLRTTDGGAHWSTSHYETRNGVLSVVSFMSRTHGWIMSDSALFLTTTNGGLTWDSLPSLGWFIPFTMRFINDSLGYITGGSPWYGILDGSDVGRTVDGGRTWTWRQPRAQQPAWLVALDVQGPRWAWSTGQYDSMALTRDGGATWLIKYLSNSGVNLYNGVAFGDTTIGVAVGFSVSSPIIARTSDGGFTWTQHPATATRYLTSAEMSDTIHAWACGGGGTIIASTDGGMNWETQVSGTGLTLNKIWFVNDNQGWTVGDSGVILHTDDGGRSGVCSEPSRLTPITSRLTVFPNPFTSFTSIPSHEADHFALYDVSGRRVGVYRGDRIGEGLKAGVYFVRAEKGDRRSVLIVKVR